MPEASHRQHLRTSSDRKRSSLSMKMSSFDANGEPIYDNKPVVSSATASPTSSPTSTPPARRRRSSNEVAKVTNVVQQQYYPLRRSGIYGMAGGRRCTPVYLPPADFCNSEDGIGEATAAAAADSSSTTATEATLLPFDLPDRSQSSGGDSTAACLPSFEEAEVMEVAAIRSATTQAEVDAVAEAVAALRRASRESAASTCSSSSNSSFNLAAVAKQACGDEHHTPPPVPKTSRRPTIYSKADAPEQVKKGARPEQDTHEDGPLYRPIYEQSIPSFVTADSSNEDAGQDYIYDNQDAAQDPGQDHIYEPLPTHQHQQHKADAAPSPRGKPRHGRRKAIGVRAGTGRHHAKTDRPLPPVPVVTPPSSGTSAPISSPTPPPLRTHSGQSVSSW